MQRVWLAVTQHNALMREAARMAPNEAGGVLLGYRGEGGDLVITEVIGAGPSALHAPTQFLPDHSYQERQIAERYEASGRMHTYLGDWHSHPKGTSTLSVSDRATLRRISTARDARVQEPLMLIVSGGVEEWDIAVYRLKWHRVYSRIQRIALVIFNA